MNKKQIQFQIFKNHYLLLDRVYKTDGSRLVDREIASNNFLNFMIKNYLSKDSKFNLIYEVLDELLAIPETKKRLLEILLKVEKLQEIEIC